MKNTLFQVQKIRFCTLSFLLFILLAGITIRSHAQGTLGDIFSPFDICDYPCPYSLNCEEFICKGDLDTPLFFPAYENQVHAMCPWLPACIENGSGGVDYFHGGTPDYYHSSGTMSLSNTMGTQANCTINGASPTVGGYFGLFTYEPGLPNTLSPREYIQTRFITPLQPGAYVITFYVSLADNCQIASEFGVLLSATRPMFTSSSGEPIPATAYLSVPVITDKTGWTQVQLNVTVPVGGNYQYLTIGNFKNNTNTSITTGLGGTDARAYYFIDEISVTGPPPITQCCDFDRIIQGGDVNSGPPASWSSLIGNVAVGESLLLTGMWEMDMNVTLDHATVAFGPNANIFIGTGYHLTIDDSHLYACEAMWLGIDANSKSNAKVTMRNSRLYDAIIGIQSGNGSDLVLEYNIFDRNQSHLEIKNYAGTYPLSFKGNQLLCTAPLKAPNNGQYTGTAMSVINVGHVNLAPLTTLADSNAFRDAGTGLKIINSEVRLANAIFENINKNGGQSWCVHAVAGSDLRILDIVDRVGTSPVLPNKFSKSDNGILIEGDVNRVFEANIKRNTFVDIEGAGVAVHRHINPSNDIYYGHIDISNNNFSTSVGKPGMLTGIYVKDTDRLFVTILSNNIVNGANRKGSEGIVVTNAVYNVATGIANSTYYKIINNDIDRFQRGIYTAFLTEPKIEGNDVILNGTGTHQYHGIWVNNNRTPNILANDIHGTFQDWRSIGLRMENSFASQVGCNFTEQTGIAHWYQLGNDPAKIFYNEMDDYHTAIAVTAGAIGIQYKFGNVPYTMRNKWEKNATNDELFAEGGTDAVGNRFYLATSAGPYEENITDFSSISTGGPAIEYYAFPQIGGDYNDDAIAGRIGTYSYTCPPEDATVIKPNGWNLGAFLKKAGAVLEFTEENDWHRSRQAYGFLRDNPGYLDSSAVIEDWYDSTHLTNTRYFHEVYEKLAEKDFSGAITVNNSITPSGSMETAYQDFLGILISEYYQADTLPSYTLTFIARAMIEDMADNCPVEYGDLVFMARRFLLDVAGDANEIISDCEENYYMPTGAAKWAQSQNEEKVTVSVYPNPAKDALYITSAGDATYQLVDITGRIIMAGRIYEGTFDLPLAGILPGVYNFVIVNHDSVLQTTRIVIMH